MKKFLGRVFHKDACPKHHFQYSYCFAIKLILNVLFPNIFLQYQEIVVNNFSGSKDSNFEQIRRGLE